MSQKHSKFYVGLSGLVVVSFGLLAAVLIQFPAQQPTEEPPSVVTASPETRLKNLLKQYSQDGYEIRFGLVDINETKQREKWSEYTVISNGVDPSTQIVYPPTSAKWKECLDERELPEDWSAIHALHCNNDDWEELNVVRVEYEDVSGKVVGVEHFDDGGIDARDHLNLANLEAEHGEITQISHHEGGSIGIPLPKEFMQSMLEEGETLEDLHEQIPSLPDNGQLWLTRLLLPSKSVKHTEKWAKSQVTELPKGQLQWKLTTKPEFTGLCDSATILFDEKTGQPVSGELIKENGRQRFLCKVLSIAPYKTAEVDTGVPE